MNHPELLSTEIKRSFMPTKKLSNQRAACNESSVNFDKY